MHHSERQRRILSTARDAGYTDVTQLVADLAVAPETIRRDLRVLERRGLLKRIHGGAYPVETACFETNLETRTTRHLGEKRRVAMAAIERLGGAETIFIDEGFTPQLIAQALPRDQSLTVVTASLGTAAVLTRNPGVNVMMLGGRVRGRTLATVDFWGTEMLSGLSIDLAFVGANGISLEHGLTTPDPAVAEVKAQVIQASRRRVFIGVHEKFGVCSFCRFADVPDLEAIVTDSALSEAEAQRYRRVGPQVYRA
ncbi:DeoR/GlpR family DNA-binding transcription regulator [Cryptosporangium sp. NPDC051539]|uniref:DeoR/GlpR family DNA-binding transcription regulator n=1 Tax=Cryptosporangium sp. NPDC051539 TaxID=3363962 RepID=UPI00378EED91